MTHCKVCGGVCKTHDVLDFNRVCQPAHKPNPNDRGETVEYVLCTQCGFCFAPLFDRWLPDDFSSKIYNDEYVRIDPDYIDVRPRANAALLNKQLGEQHTLIRHLDYGGGNGLLTQLLTDSGWNSVSLEPYGEHVNQPDFKEKFNLVTAFEVFEHVTEVNLLVAKLAGLLDETGLIFFSSLSSDGHIVQGRPLDWWYAAPRNGHVSLFSRKSLAILGHSVGLHYQCISDNLHAYWKNLPSWADSLLKGSTQDVSLLARKKDEMSNFNNEFNCLAQTRYGPLLYNRFDQYVGGSIAAYGEFSEGEAAMFGQLVGTGGVVVEAGANIGAHTVHLARRVGETGVVYAFEPQRIVFQTLCANLALNQLVNVVARQQGCGRQAGEMVLPNVDPRAINNFGGLSLLTEGLGEKVGIVTIDSLELTRCNLIKVDVEGMEEAVIAGAVNTITRLRPVLYLENDRSEKSASLIHYLQSLNYRIWWHLSPLFNADNFAKNSHNIFGNIVSINLLCQPAETARPVAGLREITDANDQWDQQSGRTADGK